MLALAIPASAQGVTRLPNGSYGRVQDTQAAAPGFFYFARPDEPVISVTAVGGMTASGVYFLGAGTELADMIALAGGVTSPTGEDPTVRLVRQREAPVETKLSDLYAPGARPVVLQDGDVVEVTMLTSNVPGFFVHSHPGEERVTVTAAGTFVAPGRYVLDEGSTVGDLLSVAGGVAATERDTRVETTTTVRVYRDGGVLLESPLSDLYARQTLALRTGDVVDVEVVRRQRSSFTWRDGLSIVTTVLAAVLAIDTLRR